MLPKTLTAAPRDQRQPMTNLATRVMASLLPLGDALTPVKPSELLNAMQTIVLTEDAIEHPIVKSFINHVSLTDALYDPAMAAQAIVMCHNPAVATLWAWTLYRRGVELGRPYTLNDFADDFPDGPPTDEAALAIWDAQKGEGPSAFFPTKTDNILDIAETWKEAASAE